MEHIVGVKINNAGDKKNYLTHGMKLDIGDEVIVEADRGLDNGLVLTVSREVTHARPGLGPLKKIIRKVNPWDEKQISKNEQKREGLIDICRKKIEERELSMKLVDAEYTFDRSKILFYFTAEKRVDFRQLVKDLASIFRVRIELRQIGVRDEARMLGGCGPCGRRLCCGSFLEEFEPVTIKMAKTQNLSLNPTKISGCCGRLMCCLGYENEMYRKLQKAMPSPGKKVSCGECAGTVVSVKPLKGTMVVDVGDGRLKEVDVEKAKGEKR